MFVNLTAEMVWSHQVRNNVMIKTEKMVMAVTNIVSYRMDMIVFDNQVFVFLSSTLPDFNISMFTDF